MINKSLKVIIIGLFLIGLFNCEQQKTSQRNPLKGLSDTANDYDKPQINHPIIFPDAHDPKKSYRQEWWYITANLITEDGQSLATQWTLFRRAVEDKHWYFAHSALANNDQHFSAFRSGREELANVIINRLPFSATIDDWQWQSTETLFPAVLNYGSTVIEQKSSQTHNSETNNLESNNPWRVKLHLDSKSNFFLQGEQGYSKKHWSLDIASYYYSQPFINVHGEVYWQGRWQKVNGKAWFDREWGSQMLAADQQGWDWFSLRLDQDTALMVYRIRSNIEDHVYGSLMSYQGNIETLSPQDIKVSSIHNSSAINNTYYPQAFNLVIEKKNIALTVSVVNPKQIMRFGIEYFEGMVTFSGSHQGQGFLEMTGYHK